MTRIEAQTILEAPPPTVWRHLVDHERWPEWFRPPQSGAARPAPAGGLRLESVALRPGQSDRVGTERECVASLGPLPIPGFRRPFPLRWTDRVADVHAPWLMELDVAGARPPFARARLRLILVEGAPGQTRLRLRLTYAPGLYWLLDVLWLRRALAAGLRRALAALHARYPATPAVAAPAAEAGAPASGHVRAAA